MSNIAKPNNKASRNTWIKYYQNSGTNPRALEVLLAERNRNAANSSAALNLFGNSQTPVTTAPAALTAPATAVKGSRNFLFNNAPKTASAGPLFTGSLNTTEEAEKARAEIRERANAAYAQSAVKAPFVGQPAPSAPEIISTPANNAYNKAKRLANSRKSCTACEEVILEKLDTLLTQNKSTFAVGFNSANKTVQSALDATAVGLNKISTEGKVGLGVAAASTLAGAVRVGRAASTGVAAAAAAATAAGTAVSEVTVTAIRAAGSELERAAKIARKCVKGNATGSNRSVKCAAAYAAVQEAMDKLKALIPAGLVIPWPSGFKFPVSNYFTLKNNKGMTKFNRNVSNARGVLGRFGTRVSAGLGAFGSRVGTAARTIRNVAGKGASAVSRAMYRLSGREQADMIKQLLLDSQALKDQGKLTGQAVAQLQAAMAAAQPGVVTPAVAAAAAAVASPAPSNGLVTAAAKEEAAPVAAAPASVGGRKRSRKNRSRKGSRKNRKNRKSSRKH